MTINNDDYLQSQRLGFRVPRSILLPPYLALNRYFVDFLDAVDEVFLANVDSKMDILANLRNMWSESPQTEQIIIDEEILDFEDWPQPERDILVKQTNMLGMNFQNAGVLSNDAYQQITRHVGQYWFEKGTEAFIKFINYALKADLTVSNLWTTDYVVFVHEEDAGTPIWEGGDYFPTTHVEIRATGGLGDLDLVTLNAFFYEIANYNLVLASIDASFDMPIVDRFEDGHTTADIVAVGIFAVNSMVISTEFRYGADAPAFDTIDPAIPTSYYSLGGSTVDFSTAFLLADPSAWIADDQGRKFPVYSLADRVITEDATLPTQLMGTPSLTNEYSVLYGPVEFLPIPGSSRSTARLPVYSSGISTIKDTTTLSTKMIGTHRTNILVNPLGFTEIAPGKFIPFW